MIDLKWELIKMIDGEGRNPLHLAASSGNLEAARYLLAKYPLNATRRDKGGELPIHLAALGGHVAVISLLLRDFPEVDELVDMSGQNILHKASWMGRVNVVRYVLKNPILDCLINMKDEFGSTPLHMARLRDNYRTVRILTRDKRVDIMALNNKGLTAVEAAEEDKKLKNPNYTKPLTCFQRLKALIDPRFLDSGDVSKKVYKERVGVFMVVAALIASAAFGAGFVVRVEGDLKGTDRWKYRGSQAFVVFDTIAMDSSIFILGFLAWAQFGEINLVADALVVSSSMLGIAMISMIGTFSMGVNLVFKRMEWLQVGLLGWDAIFALVMGIIINPLAMYGLQWSGWHERRR